MSGRWVELEQLLDRVDHLSSPAALADSNGQAEAAVLIDHVEKLEGPPIHRLVEMEVDRPDVSGYSARNSSRLPPGGRDRLRRRGRGRCSPSSHQIRCTLL